MASLFGKLAGIARSPQGQKAISTATRKAKELANDPATRAKIDQGTARVKAEVDKRRGTGSTGTTPSGGTTGTTGTPGSTPVTPDVTPG